MPFRPFEQEQQMAVVTILLTTTDSSSFGHVVIQELVENLQMVMEPYPKSVPLYITVDHDVPPVIVSNDLKVFRSALNYLTNACKKTVKGKVHLKISVLQEPKKMLLLECHDTGPSIPMEQYPFLFRPYLDQLDTTTRRLHVCFIHHQQY